MQMASLRITAHAPLGIYDFDAATYLVGIFRTWRSNSRETTNQRLRCARSLRNGSRRKLPRNHRIKSMRTLLVATLLGWCWTAHVMAGELHPIVEVETGYLLGAVADGKWIKAEAAIKSLRPGVSFRLYDLAGETRAAKGGKVESAGDPCPDTFVIPLTPKPKGGVVGLAAPWNALPRVPRIADTTQAAYLAAVREFLVSHGLRKPEVKITRILRIDLEGDGEREVLISATNYDKDHDGMPSSSRPDTYSCVLLRRMVHGRVRTLLVAGEFYPKAKTFNAPSEYEIAAVLDLNGDGRMEVVVHSAYYEGGGTAIYQCGESKITELLGVACGA